MLPVSSTMGRGALGKAGAPQKAGLGERALLWHPTCWPVPQGQPHHVAAQVVGKAVHPLVIEPVTRCLLQLTAGQGWWGQSGAGGAVCCAPIHPGCCHTPGTQAQWAKSAGDGQGPFTGQLTGPATSSANTGASQVLFVGQGRPKGRKPGMLETQAVQGAQGDAAVSSGGEGAGHHEGDTRVGYDPFLHHPNMGTLPRSDSRASCPALGRSSQARKGWLWGIKLRQLRGGKGQEGCTECPCPLSRLLTPPWSRLCSARSRWGCRSGSPDTPSGCSPGRCWPWG